MDIYGHISPVVEQLIKYCQVLTSSYTYRQSLKSLKMLSGSEKFLHIPPERRVRSVNVGKCRLRLPICPCFALFWSGRVKTEVIEHFAETGL